ncbi:unnamed protein product [Rhizoctonia solani]|uniref:Uncharacterized protein n=1 Tax=Rhizoctonia solani TaxID=456999 RepID=A0A8H3DD98_9AGAM|nr:unnamed protein product [Rhizoctonia solani]
MSAVAVQTPLVGFPQTFRQNRHSAAPPAALVTPAKNRTPGIITLSRPPTNQRQSPRQRKAAPSASATAPSPKSEKQRKPRSRPSSDEEEHETKPRGRRSNAEKSPVAVASPAPKRRTPSRARQTPSPQSEPTPQLEKPSGRLARRRGGFTKSTPALCAAVAAPGSAPMPITMPSAASPSGLSRSAPMATHMPQSLPARMRRSPTSNGRDDQKEAPPSPSPRRVRDSKAPLTAPLNSAFPRPLHVRSPSEAIFNLSLDEPEEPQAMPILFPIRGGDKVYAGGRFQNGPDTTTLPVPSFLSGF